MKAADITVTPATVDAGKGRPEHVTVQADTTTVPAGSTRAS